MYKKGFSLLEMSIVLIILALVMGIFLSLGKSIYKVSKVEATKYELQTIKNSLIAHISVQGKLPKSDSNGDGLGDTTGLGDLPYLDLNLKANDSYGMIYKYDVSDYLINTNINSVCRQIANVYLEKMDINNTTYYPQMVDESNVSQYTVAAVVISKGVDKVLSGANNGSNRKYEMALNKYNVDNRDDIVIELDALELIGKVCNLSEDDISGAMSIQVWDKDKVRYVLSDDPSNCVKLEKERIVTVNENQNITFYHERDNNCNDNSLFKTYMELRAIDIDPKDYFLYIKKGAGGGDPAPTLEDN